MALDWKLQPLFTLPMEVLFLDGNIRCLKVNLCVKGDEIHDDFYTFPRGRMIPAEKMGGASPVTNHSISKILGWFGVSNPLSPPKWLSFYLREISFTSLITSLLGVENAMIEGCRAKTLLLRCCCKGREASPNGLNQLFRYGYGNSICIHLYNIYKHTSYIISYYISVYTVYTYIYTSMFVSNTQLVWMFSDRKLSVWIPSMSPGSSSMAWSIIRVAVGFTRCSRIGGSGYPPRELRKHIPPKREFREKSWTQTTRRGGNRACGCRVFFF